MVLRVISLQIDSLVGFVDVLQLMHKQQQQEQHQSTTCVQEFQHTVSNQPRWTVTKTQSVQAKCQTKAVNTKQTKQPANTSIQASIQ
jgi:hypothetical protein